MKKLICVSLFVLSLQPLTAQTLEPKLYANAPVGVNIVLVGYGRTQGGGYRRTLLLNWKIQISR